MGPPPVSCSSCTDGGGTGVQGMAAWWVSEPYINLRIEDEPLWYEPAVGAPIVFHLSYRQRGSPPETSAVFGAGTNWSLSFRAYLVADGTGKYRLHRGGAGFIDYIMGVPHFDDGSLLTDTNGLRLERADGGCLSFGEQVTVSPSTLYFLTTQTDPYGNSVKYHYTNSGTFIRLLTVEDGDGRFTELQYKDPTFTNLITAVVDPFGRTARLGYNSNGMLSSIVDVQSLESSFGYGTNKVWVDKMTTDYGTTTFRHGGADAESSTFTTDTNAANRFIEVSLPGGGRHLYLYRQNLTDLVPSTNAPPNTAPFDNTFETEVLDWRNSLHWGPMQYAGLGTTNLDAFGTNQYAIGHLKHWLLRTGTTNASVVSLERLPSPDGLTPGQVTFYDYPGKPQPDQPGTSSSAALVAQLLPNAESRLTSQSFNQRGHLEQVVASYTTEAGSVGLRTNTMEYAANAIDLVLEVGPGGEQVRSNYFGSNPHLPAATYDAKNQETLLSYSSYGQLTQRSTPAGLTTVNVYGTSGSSLNRLERTIDVEILRTNSFTYYTNGLMATHTDERGLTITKY